MVTVMTEPVVRELERGFTLVQTLIREGPMAAWEQLKDMAGEMKDAFIDAVKDFIKQKIIEEAIKWIVSLFIPGAGIVKAIIGIYDTVVFFIQKAKQIMQMISSFLGSIAEIAAGNIGAAAAAMEKGLARGLSLVISFLAQLLHLSGITNKIKTAIKKIENKVDAVLLKVAKWIADKAKKLVSSALGGDPNASGQERLDRGLAEGEAAVNRYAGKVVGIAVLRPLLSVIKLKHKLTRLDAVLENDVWVLEAEVNPKKRTITRARGTGQGAFQTKIAFYPPNSNRGATRMVANPVGPEHPEGSKPKDDVAPAIWPKITVKRAGNKRLYVQGHLLNHLIGGPGDNPGNLTPITFSLNKRHSLQAETTLKEEINKKKKWFYYEVAVKYPGSARVIDPADTLKGVAPEEGLLATGLEINYYEMAPDPGDDKKLKKKAGGLANKFTIGHDIPPYPDT
jgi:hypothetical protein